MKKYDENKKIKKLQLNTESIFIFVFVHSFDYYYKRNLFYFFYSIYNKLLFTRFLSYLLLFFNFIYFLLFSHNLNLFFLDYYK